MRFINQILLLVFIVSAVKGQTISEKEFSNTIIHEDFDLASSEYFRLEKNDNNNFEIDNRRLCYFAAEGGHLSCLQHAHNIG